MAQFFRPGKRTSPTSKHQLIRIERMDHQGAGIAYQGGKPIFVEGALPGEQVLVQLTEKKSKYARARLIDVKSASSSRQLPFCPHYGSCGGCNLQHLTHHEQVRYKQETLQQLMDKIAGQKIRLAPPVTDGERGYRRRARLSLKWDPKKKKLAFGFRKKQSNHIINVSECAVLDPVLEQLLIPLYELLQACSCPDKLGHLELIAGNAGPVMLLRTLGHLPDTDAENIRAFAVRHHISLYLKHDSGDPELLSGNTPGYDETGVPTLFQPHHFIQVNRAVNQKMVNQAQEWLQLNSDDRVLDLFCGIGNFSLPVAKQVKDVVGVEGIDDMVAQGNLNAMQNHLTNLKFYQANLEGNVAENQWASERFDKILLDPARAGAKGIIDMIGQFGAERIVYVSCDPSTLARDTQSLSGQGYQLEKLGMLDMFPHTSHLESMALFVKSD
ncbi:23S rRNA (uracil(1939)-C(5))-methyltransferase RlmD [Vibrio aerogenes CECT 7868]|uniref:23S rRNA (uracil(1939)-C(5))-methyltransferase RlmD n=1 Tax=Vibrio aerogenes CECT 7868 TaxID=1216006 RepID=A0A1M5YHQ3_9VIBR|nr:23S rRNA (uracil(1939)-C(5))-methyltransferase RlmD [Vibrio aerogenes]SHI11561.1 23S rRNA (uracil(1939)-C(5))-methyltransferase RlmD [Vibrio aerogenes CECT 7868]